jgi:hypothetical protein
MELNAKEKQEVVAIALTALGSVKHLTKEIDRLHNIMTMNGVE